MSRSVEEVQALAERWGEPRMIVKRIPVAPGLTEQVVRGFFSDRWGEVVMVIRRAMDGLVWVMTKESFPVLPARSEQATHLRGDVGLETEDRPLYSLPTGGIGHDEGIEVALWRELEEETGFQAQVERFVAVVRYVPVLAGGDPQDVPGFTSYVFLLREETGQDPVLGCGERILDFKAVSPGQLLGMAEEWRALCGSSDEFHDLAAWGMFRSLTHQVAGEALVENGRAKVRGG